MDGPGRQPKLPAGFFKAVREKNRLTASKLRVFGGFEDMPGADPALQIEDARTAPVQQKDAIASDRFAPILTISVNL